MPEVALFSAAFLAATLLPFSSEIALISAIKLGMNPYSAVLFASLGNILAIVVNYYIGLFIRRKSYKKLLKSKLGKKVLHYSKNYGYWSLLLTPLPIIGDPITIASGIFKIRLWLFIMIAGSLRVGRYVGIVFFLS
jgi:membrane protein YqaA with SNARE-associated domain